MSQALKHASLVYYIGPLCFCFVHGSVMIALYTTNVIY